MEWIILLIKTGTANKNGNTETAVVQGGEGDANCPAVGV